MEAQAYIPQGNHTEQNKVGRFAHTLHITRDNLIKHKVPLEEIKRFGEQAVHEISQLLLHGFGNKTTPATLVSKIGVARSMELHDVFRDQIFTYNAVAKNDIDLQEQLIINNEKESRILAQEIRDAK